MAPRYVHYDPAAFAPRGAIEVWDHPARRAPERRAIRIRPTRGAS